MGTLALAPDPANLALVASAAGQKVRVMGRQGEYYITHPRDVKHALSLPNAAERQGLSKLHHETADGVPTLKPATRAEVEATGEEIHRGTMEHKIQFNAVDGTLKKKGAMVLRWSATSFRPLLG